MWIAQKFCKTTQAIENKLSALRNRIFPEIRYSKYRDQLVNFVRNGLKDGEYILQRAFEEMCHEYEKNILLQDIRSLVKKKHLSCDFYKGSLVNLNVDIREDLRDIGLGVRKKIDLSTNSLENNIEILFNQTKTSKNIPLAKISIDPDQLCHRDLKVYIANEILKQGPKNGFTNQLLSRLKYYLEQSKLMADTFNAIPNDVTILPLNTVSSETQKDETSKTISNPVVTKNYQLELKIAIFALTTIFILLFSIWFGQNHENSIQVSNIEDIITDKYYINQRYHQKIHHVFSQPHSNEQNKVISITGNDGMGKTTLAQLYAKLQPASIKWTFNCESNDHFLISLHSIAKELVLEDPSLSDKLSKIEKSIDNDKFRLFLNFLRRHTPKNAKKIFIFDNLNFNTAHIMKLLPRQKAKWGSVDILITSDDSDLKNSNCVYDNIHLDKIDKKDFLEIIRISINIDQPDIKADLEEAIKHCQLTPLLAYMLVKSKLEEPEKSFKDIVNNVFYTKDSNPYESNKSDRSIQDILVKRIESKIIEDYQLKKLLICLSYLNPQNIPLYLLEGFFSHIPSKVLRSKLKSIMGSFSKEGSYEMINFHPCLHKILVSYVQKLPPDHEAIVDFMGFLIAKTNDDNKSLNDEKLRLSLIHLKQIVKKSTFKSPASLSEIYFTIGKARRYFGQREKALKDFSQALNFVSKTRNSVQYSQILSEYCLTNRYLGEYKKAISLLEARCNENVSANEKLGCYKILALLYRDIGDYNRSINCYKLCLETDPADLPTKTELGIIYHKIGLPAEGLKLYQEIQASLPKKLQECRLKNRFKLLHALHLEDDKSSENSLIELKDLLDDMIKRHGEKYLLTGLLYCDVGEIYIKNKKFSQGFHYLEKGLFIIMKRVGIAHPIFMRKKLKTIHLMIKNNFKNPRSELKKIRNYITQNNPNFIPYLYSLEKELGIDKPENLKTESIKKQIESLYPKKSKLYNSLYKSVMQQVNL
ncbi:MAG: tetratricopeptide repeat protein [Alphaproteobacteria bacterium]|nr:MAG: tetratricopeptide repeat protein [Alphaproteobacteria bacterium]